MGGGGRGREREREAAVETLSRSQALLLLFLLLSLSASQAVYRAQIPGIPCKKKRYNKERQKSAVGMIHFARFMLLFFVLFLQRAV